MKGVSGSIIVYCDTSQKEEAIIAGNKLKTGKKYNENFRERNPVIAEVITGTAHIPKGAYIICNYSHFDLESPYEISHGTYSIPVDGEIYVIINSDGSLTPICGNVLVERINQESIIDLPLELKRPHTNRGILLNDFENMEVNDFVFWLPYSDYQICYTWNGEERTALKIHSSEIVGYLKKD